MSNRNISKTLKHNGIHHQRCKTKLENAQRPKKRTSMHKRNWNNKNATEIDSKQIQNIIEALQNEPIAKLKTQKQKP